MKLIFDKNRIENLRISSFNKMKYAGYVPEFNEEETKQRMIIHYTILENSIRNFGLYLWVYFTKSNIWTRFKMIRAIPYKRLQEIVVSYTKRIEEHYITINEVFKLAKALNLTNDFLSYFISKTNMSYTIFKNHEIHPAGLAVKNPEEHDNLKPKFSQFIYVILTEYILLHNIMYASEFKLKDVTSIDPWLKDLD